MTALPSPAMTDDGYVIINFKGPASLREAIKTRAAKLNMSASAYMREVMAAALGESDLLRDLERARKRAERMTEK